MRNRSQFAMKGSPDCLFDHDVPLKGPDICADIEGDSYKAANSPCHLHTHRFYLDNGVLGVGATVHIFTAL